MGQKFTLKLKSAISMENSLSRGKNSSYFTVTQTEVASTRYGRRTDVANELAKSKYRSQVLYFSLNLANDRKCSRVNTVLDMMS